MTVSSHMMCVAVNLYTKILHSLAVLESLDSGLLQSCP